jgi:EpsI family protein
MKSSFLAFWMTFAVLVGAIALSRTAARRIPEELARPLNAIDTAIADWAASTTDRTLDSRVLSRLVPTSYLSRTYRKQELSLDLFIAYYSVQRAGESMHSPKHCLPGGGWEIWRHGAEEVRVDGRTHTINKYSIENNGARMLMFYWYQSASRIVASEYMGKVLLARDTLLTGRTAGSIVRIVLPDRPEAADEGAKFAAAIIPEVERCFTSRPAVASR